MSALFASIPPSLRYVLVGGSLGLLTALGAILDPLGLFELAELSALNGQFALRGSHPPEAPIVIVTIDGDSFDELDLAWPWPRALYGQFLDRVREGKPAVVGLDIVFAEPSVRGPAERPGLRRRRRAGRPSGARGGAHPGPGCRADQGGSQAAPAAIRAGAAAWGFVNFGPSLQRPSEHLGPRGNDPSCMCGLPRWANRDGRRLATSRGPNSWLRVENRNRVAEFVAWRGAVRTPRRDRSP